MVADVERLRVHLGIERWLVFGTSWGSTLALAYAERHPASVGALVLAAVGTTRRSELDWLYRGVGAFFPAEYARFRAGHEGDLVDAYARMLADPDRAVRAHAADEFSRWELAVVGAAPWPGSWRRPRSASAARGSSPTCFATAPGSRRERWCAMRARSPAFPA
jgi:proline iminopeptidase